MARNRSGSSLKKAVSRGGDRSTARRSSGRDYWRIAGGIAGLAVTAILLLTMLGGRRGIAAKARELLDWEIEGDRAPGSDGNVGEQRGDAEAARPH